MTFARSLPGALALAWLWLAGSAPARADGKVGWPGPPVAAAAPDDVKAGLAQADALYDEREKAGSLGKVLEALRGLQKAHADSYDVNWRLARALFWQAEGTGAKDQKRALATEGRQAAGKAAAANAKGPEALYFGALCIGEYSHSVGILTALSEGIEAKFRDPLLEVAKLDPNIDNGGVWNALGRYKFELPWPKRDYDQSVTWLRKSIETNPKNLRGRFYLAESLAARDDKGDEAEARKLFKEVLDAGVGQYDTAEEQRSKDLARASLAKLGWTLQ